MESQSLIGVTRKSDCPATLLTGKIYVYAVTAKTAVQQVSISFFLLADYANQEIGFPWNA